MRTRHFHSATRWASALVVALAAAAGATTASAAGFELKEQAAAAQGRALAVTASIDDATAIHFNPAGLAFVRDTHVVAGGMLVVPGFTSTPAADARDYEPDTKFIAVPQIYLATKVFGHLGLGLGFNAPFGMRLAWPAGYPGEKHVASADVRTLYTSLATAWDFADLVPGLAVGAGLDVVHASAGFSQRLSIVADDGSPTTLTAELGGSKVAFGWHAGAQYRAFDGKLRAGARYRSKVTYPIDGSATFSAPGLSDMTRFPDQAVRTQLSNPAALSLGVGYEVIDGLFVEFDYDRTFWGGIDRDVRLTFPHDKTGTLSSVKPQRWIDTSTFRLGAEYAIGPRLRVRTGAGYDYSPVPDETLSPMLPDADRIFLNAGASWMFDARWGVDLGYTWASFADRDVRTVKVNPFPAAYTGAAHLLAMNLRAAF